MTAYTFNQLFDFTRTTSATFVGSNGLIQTTPASVNLLTYTQEFDNAAWTKATTTVTANATTAPDNTSTADKIIASASAGYKGVFRTVAAVTGNFALSVYAKAAEYTKCYISDSSTGTYRAAFDLTGSGSVSGTGGGNFVSASITSVGNGWYRCVIITNFAGTGQTPTISGYPNSGATLDSVGVQFTGDGTSGIFLWGAQAELNTVATTYARNNGGVYPARFDYDPVTLAPKGILIEEQRTNLFPYSEDFANAIWVKGGVTVSADATTSPDGTVDADKIVEDTSTGNHNVYNGGGGAAGAHTMSVFAKPAGRNWLVVRIEGFDAYFNLATGTIGTVGPGLIAAITPAANGYYRCAITKTLAGATACTYRLATGDNVSSYTGDGTSGIFLWGAQLELGAFPTSYIPTVASQVTRTADVCSITAPMFAPWYNQTEGTFVAQFSGPSGGYALNTNDGTNNNATGLVYVAASTVRGITVAAGTGRFVDMTAGATPIVNKTAYGYKANDLAGSTNGGAVVTNATAVIPTLTQMFVGTFSNFSFLNGHIRSVKYFPFRASNNQLQALTL
jgi:hypothetical protein